MVKPQRGVSPKGPPSSPEFQAEKVQDDSPGGAATGDTRLGVWVSGTLALWVSSWRGIVKRTAIFGLSQRLLALTRVQCPVGYSLGPANHQTKSRHRLPSPLV